MTWVARFVAEGADGLAVGLERRHGDLGRPEVAGTGE